MYIQEKLYFLHLTLLQFEPILCDYFIVLTEMPGKFGGGQTSPDISHTFVGEYKYTVNVGDQRIRIYGSNANLVRVS